MPMTAKERWLAALRTEPVDRLHFWLKLNRAYPRARTEPFRNMNIDAIHDWIGGDVAPRRLDITKLQHTLRANGAILDEADIKRVNSEQ